MPIPVSDLIGAAGPLFGVSRAEILGPSRVRPIFLARAAVCLAARTSGRSYAMIGQAIGGRDHKTIMDACDRAETWHARDAAYRASCEALIAMGREWAAKYTLHELVSKHMVRRIKAQGAA